MTYRLKAFIKKANGSAVASEPNSRLTDKKINRICNSVKLEKGQTVKKLLER